MTKIVSVFPDCGKYNPIKLTNKFANIYVNKYRKMEGSSAPNPEFPQNYLDIVEKCIGEFDVVLVSSNPQIRDPLAKKFPQNMTVVYLKGDETTKNKLIDKIKSHSSNLSIQDQNYIQMIERNWDHWHTEAKLFCIENNIPYIEVESTEEAQEVIENL